MAQPSEDWGFTFARVVDGPITRAVARAICGCGAHHDLSVTKADRSMPPDEIVKKFIAAGWTRARRNAPLLCPACSGRDNKVVKLEDRKMSKTETAQPAMRELTPAEKRKVRELLDGHFDEELGAYLDGYSDERIAAEVMAPRAAVTKIREDAYGPIKVDPELQAIRERLDKLEKDAGALLETVRESLAPIRTEIESLRNATVNAERRLGVRR